MAGRDQAPRALGADRSCRKSCASTGASSRVVVAFGITWGLDVPFVLACLKGNKPSETAGLMAGFGALGPTLAAAIVAAADGDLRTVFGRWRTRPLWLLVALALPATLHIAATAIDVALGGQPAHWLYPPARPEHVVALVMFSFGEEFGWRGFAYPRLERRHGPVIGSLMLGAIWGLWHFGMLFTPEQGAPRTTMVLFYVVSLALWSVVMAWLFERSDRSIAVAIALHAGGHLDNVFRVPESEVRLRVVHVLVLAAAAGLSARALVLHRRKARATVPVDAVVD